VPDGDELGRAAVDQVDLVAGDDSLNDAFTIQGHSDAQAMDRRVGGETVWFGLYRKGPVAAQAPESHPAGLHQPGNCLGQPPEEDR